MFGFNPVHVSTKGVSAFIALFQSVHVLPSRLHWFSSDSNGTEIVQYIVLYVLPTLLIVAFGAVLSILGSEISAEFGAYGLAIAPVYVPLNQ